MNEIVPEFSRLISVARLSPNGVEEFLEAKPDERAALVKRFDLVDMPVLTAQLTLMPGAQQTVAVTGKIEAEIVQHCVVTLEPISNKMALDVALVFSPTNPYPEEEEVQPDELNDEIEVFSNGKIDLGEMIAQQVGINIDPYPRKADAALTTTEFGPKIEKPHPFAQLAAAVQQKKKDS